MDPLVLLLAVPVGLALTWVSFYVAAHAVLKAWRRSRMRQVAAEEDLADARAEERLARMRTGRG
ncbi:hypothetical protein [Anaeromyxobacter dehalogenans]|uniref:Uncharacterized protein n=1 Tax=Anaeromyxobacter dehalogenans (strain ATCC BAA-258 / DSM 21875 / 2CP-1) TaxID=455488 RepID=B8J6X1_ANAD2|nr:hypothetical protein [Anaeromyxobacter dehalogenans]ACL67093.1 conserved hypothetical protein [Anaeromyxobacter dehalogenans 2CP-1]